MDPCANVEDSRVVLLTISTKNCVQSIVNCCVISFLLDSDSCATKYNKFCTTKTIIIVNTNLIISMIIGSMNIMAGP